MKKISTLAMYFMAFILTGLLTSCDEDIATAETLSGEWYGDFGMFYTIEQRGHVYTFDSYDTRIVFYPDYEYATHGRGKQVDYYQYGPYEYQYYEFFWDVHNGHIALTYPYDPELNTTISNYSMNSYRFTGCFGLSSDKFYLRKIADFYDWSPYGGNYGYYDRPGWTSYYPYYAPTRADSDSLTSGSVAREADAQDITILARGNRFNR